MRHWVWEDAGGARPRTQECERVPPGQGPCPSASPGTRPPWPLSIGCGSALLQLTKGSEEGSRGLGTGVRGLGAATLSWLGGERPISTTPVPRLDSIQVSVWVSGAQALNPSAPATSQGAPQQEAKWEDEQPGLKARPSAEYGMGVSQVAASPKAHSRELPTGGVAQCRPVAPALTPLSPSILSRVPATVPEPGLLQPAPALRLPLGLPRSPLRGGHSRGRVRPAELPACTAALCRGRPKPAQEQHTQRTAGGQSPAARTTAAASQVSPLSGGASS